MYCTIEDIKARYPDSFLVSISSESNTIDDKAFAVINNAIGDSTEEIKAYSSQYNFETTPKLIIKLCVEITINTLLRRIEQVDDTQFESRQNWIKSILKDLSQSKIDFSSETIDDKPNNIVFSSDTLRGW